MINTEFYTKQLNRRRSWDVIEVSPEQKLVPGSERTLQKALALSALELPVGDMINSVVDSHHLIPDSVLRLLRANAQDEDKHDLALSRLRKTHEPLAQDDEYAKFAVERAMKLADHLSPLVVAGVLEASIFFVILPMYRFLGGGGFRTIANDISNDENIHVATNVNLAKDLGWDRHPALNRFRNGIMTWLVDDLGNANENKYLNRDFWLASSESLYNAGKAPQLKETRRSVMPSFFEKSNHDLPRYS